MFLESHCLVTKHLRWIYTRSSFCHSLTCAFLFESWCFTRYIDIKTLSNDNNNAPWVEKKSTSRAFHTYDTGSTGHLKIFCMGILSLNGRVWMETLQLNTQLLKNSGMRMPYNALQQKIKKFCHKGQKHPEEEGKCLNFDKNIMSKNTYHSSMIPV